MPSLFAAYVHTTAPHRPSWADGTPHCCALAVVMWQGMVLRVFCCKQLSEHCARVHSTRGACDCGLLWCLPCRAVLGSGVLFCSPEVYTSNHKTELLDDAVSAVFKRLGARQGRGDNSDDLWCWDTRRNQWCGSPAASKLLLDHHKLHWAPMVIGRHRVGRGIQAGTSARLFCAEPNLGLEVLLCWRALRMHLFLKCCSVVTVARDCSPYAASSAANGWTYNGIVARSTLSSSRLLTLSSSGVLH
jgi:hypothetical protein